MSKLSSSRLTEVSKLLATKAGSELKEFITYVAGLAEDVVSGLKNGLTFRDNFNCKYTTLSLTDNTASGINTDGRRPLWIQCVQVISTEYGLDSWTWYIDSDGSCQVKATFTGSPSAAVEVAVLIFYG